jgi:hypothetical protein
MFQQQLPSCFENFIRSNRQYFGHECVDQVCAGFLDYTSHFNFEHALSV